MASVTMTCVGSTRSSSTSRFPAMARKARTRICRAPTRWRSAMTALGFYERLEREGFGDLGIVIDSEEKRAALLSLLDELFATGPRDHWVAKLRTADIVAAPINTLLEASNDPDVVANGYV